MKDIKLFLKDNAISLSAILIAVLMTAFLAGAVISAVKSIINSIPEQQPPVIMRVPVETPVPAGDNVLGAGFLEHASYNAIGTVASPVTLTNVFANNSSTVILVTGMANVAFAGEYIPKTTDANLYIQLERSIDGGSTYYPYDVLQETPTQVLIYSDSFATTTSVSSPFTIPG